MLAVIDWSSAALLRENSGLFKRAGGNGKIRPRDRRTRSVKVRTLTLWDDGSCEVQNFSTSAVVKRLGGVIVRRSARKARKNIRG